MTRRGDCADFEPDLSALLDGELDEARARAVRRHVDRCGPCARDLARLGAVSGVLRRWEVDETHAVATPAFRRRVLERIGASEAAPPATANPSAATAGRLLFVRAAAAAVLLVGVGAGAAMVLSAGRAPPALDGGELRAEIARLHQETRDAVARLSAESVAGEPSSALLAPLPPWESVVAVPPDAPLERDGAEPAYTPQWEEHGDVRIAEDAFADLDRFHRDRRELALTADVRRLKAAATAAAPPRPTTDEPPASPLATFLGALALGDTPAAHDEVTVWPVLRSVRASASVTPLTTSEALPLRLLRASEGTADNADGGAVVLENRDLGGRPILVVAGDVLAGGRQDRVAAEDVLLMPGQRRSVQTRTSGLRHKRPRRSFSRSDGLAPLRIRALLAADAPQREIDAAIAASLPWLGSAGGRGSLDDLFANDQLISRADRYVRALARDLAGDDVVGFAIAAGDDLLGIEVFGDAQTFQAASDRVLRSYVLEVLSRGRIDGLAPSREHVAAALASCRSAAGAHAAAGAEGVVTFVAPDAGLLGRGLVESGRVQHAMLLTDAALPSGAMGSGRGRGETAGADGIDPDDGAVPTDGPSRGETDAGGIGTGDR